MIGETHCSGIGAPEVSTPGIDWRLGAEIEKFPRDVLAARLGYRDARRALPPGAPALWGDFTTIRARHYRRRGLPFPDLIVAGTPCQAFSIAGKRGGLADARGNLTLAFTRHCHAIANAARHDGRRPPVVLWENVPGVLSDAGNAFGCFLGELVGADDAISPPGGGSWPGAGMVEGPRARLAWRVLDAQHFGLAQRRRRVFVVVDLGDGTDPAAVLFERKGLQGDTPARRGTGENIAPTPSARPSGGGGLGTDFELDGGLIAATLDTRCGETTGRAAETGAGLVAAFGGNNTAGPIERAPALAGRCGERQDFETETLIAFSGKDHGADAEIERAPTLRAMGSANGRPNAGGQVAIAAIQERAGADMNAGPGGDGIRTDGLSYTLEARGTVQAVAVTGDISHTLNTANNGKGCSEDGTGRGVPVVGFAQNQRGELRETDIASQLTTGGGKPGEGYPAAMVGALVRRLTPVECERLQGFPDGWTAIERRGKPAADGPRYKALGNSMAVPVLGWIIARIEAAREAAAKS